MYYVFINRFSSFERIQNELLVAMDRISLLQHDLGVIQHLKLNVTAGLLAVGMLQPFTHCYWWRYYWQGIHKPEPFMRKTERLHAIVKQLAIRENCYSVQPIFFSMFRMPYAKIMGVG